VNSRRNASWSWSGSSRQSTNADASGGTTLILLLPCSPVIELSRQDAFGGVAEHALVQWNPAAVNAGADVRRRDHPDDHE
jgi:hypothetical protein